MVEGLGREQEKRVARAMLEGPHMEWAKAPDGSWIVETPSGGCYKVTERGECSCPDHRFRCAGTELRCAHVTALRIKLLAEQTTFDAETAPKTKRTKEQEREDAIFDRLYAS